MSAAGRDVVSRFLETAHRRADALALIPPAGRDVVSFRTLARDVDRLAAGLRLAGIKPGDRAALLVPPSRDFFACTFALFRLGAVPVLIDPGIGLKNMGRCLEEAKPSAFIGSPKAHLARLLGRWAPAARLSIVADGTIPGMLSTRKLRGHGSQEDFAPAALTTDTPAALLFTSGSTGAPKGAVYTHGVFAAQMDMLRSMFEIKEGESSLPTFPLFALFDVALGMTAVLPDMDFTRPGRVDPAKIVVPLQKFRVQQLFGSPALLERVGRYGERHGVALPDLTRVMSAGAPVPARTIGRFLKMLEPGVQIFTPYGATESLPVALIGSNEILRETAAMTAQGRGVCVGRPAAGVEVAVIRISDEPIPHWRDALRVSPGEVGEIVVKGPVVTREYFGRPEATAAAKIADGADVRHRMGDLGYLDESGRLWFCGRKAHRVKTGAGELYTIPVEGIFNAHPAVKRTALVGVKDRPVLCVELETGASVPREQLTRELLKLAAAHAQAGAIKTILYHPAFPVDIRHNAKISREKLAAWARAELG